MLACCMRMCFKCDVDGSSAIAGRVKSKGKSFALIKYF